jgi:hypothetical protein
VRSRGIEKPLILNFPSPILLGNDFTDIRADQSRRVRIDDLERTGMFDLDKGTVDFDDFGSEVGFFVAGTVLTYRPVQWQGGRLDTRWTRGRKLPPSSRGSVG